MSKKEFRFNSLGLSNWYQEVSENDNPYDCELCLENGYVCEIHWDQHWFHTVETIELLSDELKAFGWDFFSVGGYVGWNNSPAQSSIKEVNPENVKDMLFPYNVDSSFQIENFDELDKGYFEIKIFHHDRPMGETLFCVKEKNLESEDRWENPRYHAIDIVQDIKSKS